MDRTERKLSGGHAHNSINELTLGQVKVCHIDMSSNLIPTVYLDENEQLISQFREIGLYDAKFAYSVVMPNLLEQLITTGTYRFTRDGKPKESIFCLLACKNDFQEDTLHDGGNQQWNDYINFPNCNEGVPIAVYDRSKLENIPNRRDDEFRFTAGEPIEALVAVVILDNY